MHPLPTTAQQAIEAAQTALDQGDLLQARREAERAEASAPQHPQTLLLLAELLHQEGNTEEACARYEQCLALPLDEERAWLAHANLAELLIERSMGQEALPHARAAVELDPAELDPYLAAARAHRLLGQPSNALTWLGLALDEDEALLEAIRVRAELYASQGNYGKALSDYAAAIDLAPEQAPLYVALAEAASAVRDHELALNTLQEGLAAVPSAEQRPLHVAQARLLLQMGEVEEGVRLLDELLASAGRGGFETHPYLLRAEALLDQGEAERALADFDAVLGHEPEHLEALGGKVDALLMLERMEEALPLLNQLLTLSPSADSYNQRGDLHFMLNDLALALADYKQALALEADHPFAAYNLALTLMEQGELEVALPYLDQAVELAPHDEERLRSRSELLRRTGHPHLAWIDADRALEIDGDYIEAYLARAAAAIALESYDEALHDLDVALELYPGYGEAIAALARLLTRLNDLQGAREAWEQYVELPDAEQVPEVLIEAKNALRNA